MALFEIALAFALANEGGFANAADDAGGPTNMGVTQATLSTYLGRPATLADVQTMTRDTAAAIYKKMYWTRVQGDAIRSNSTAAFLFDMAVLMGPAQATRLAQLAVGAVSDGVFGPKTLAAINTCPPQDFALRFSRACVKMFINLVVAKPTQLKFLANWVGRADEMLTAKIS